MSPHRNFVAIIRYRKPPSDAVHIHRMGCTEKDTVGSIRADFGKGEFFRNAEVVSIEFEEEKCPG